MFCLLLSNCAISAISVGTGSAAFFLIARIIGNSSQVILKLARSIPTV